MKEENLKNTIPRRGFVTNILSAAAAFGLSSLIAPIKMPAQTTTPSKGAGDGKKWFLT